MINHQFEVVDIQGRVGLVTIRGGDLNHLEAKFPDFLRRAAEADLGASRMSWLRIGKGSTDGLAWLRDFLQRQTTAGVLRSHQEVTGGHVLVYSHPRQPWERDPSQSRPI
jgi:hypothetical protein